VQGATDVREQMLVSSDNLSPIKGNTMTKTLYRGLVLGGVLAATTLASLPSHAQDVRREDMAGYFEMQQIDKNKDGMVSKKEFMDMMSKAWDAEMAAHKAKPNAKMTREEYKAFAKMFNLDIGA
jgi:hypothetical protein